MQLHWLDITTLVAYMGILVAMGIYFSRKNTSTEEYFVGGRSFSGWIIGLSMVGTSISSVTFLAFPADAFKTAWLRILPGFTLPLIIIIAAIFFLPFYRRTRIISAYEYLEKRFGPSVRTYGAVTFMVGQLVRISMILYLLSLLMHEITGLDPLVSILVAGLFVALYTIIGGINAVIWTDVLQTIMLVLGGVFCLSVIIYELPGGFSQIIEIASRDGKMTFADWQDGKVLPVSWGFSFSEKTALMMFFVGMTEWLQEYTSNQNVIQRYAAAKSTREARKAMFVSFSNVPIWAFYFFLGTALYSFFQVFPTQESGEMLNGVRKAEQVLPYFIVNYLPPGIAGLVIAAAAAAAMSSLDSSINAISTIGVNDIYRRLWVKDRDDKHYLNTAWKLATAASIVMISGALILSQTETKTLQDTGVILISLLMGGVTGLYMIGFLTKVGDERTAWVGIILTFTFSLWTILSGQGVLPEWVSAPFDLYYTGFIGNIVMFTAIFATASLISRRKRDLTNLTVWTEDGKKLDN
ncbi:MAG: sodium:solute symporter [Candidatus Marinimicrobia bacterium]|jgi:SSS family solute:Na+ symporter|nr:sodium:solute symporter [Candidatus Neomarinimicrobiota bacterium]|tara:strand:- start:4943 stop:6511 length:1569 start_codon:yes stop_codon:yes gene_type:complete